MDRQVKIRSSTGGTVLGGGIGKMVPAHVGIGWVALEVEFSVFLGGKRVTLR